MSGIIPGKGASASEHKSTFKDATTSGNTQVVAAVANRKIRVISGVVGPVGTAINVKFQSSTTDISSTANCALNGGWANNASPGFLFETAEGEALNVNLSGNANVPVSIVYIEV